MSAHTTAMKLVNTKDPNALVGYLDEWRKRHNGHTTEYVIAVVNSFNELMVQKHEPDKAVGHLTIKFKGQIVLWRDMMVPLTVGEFRVVKLLTDHLGTHVTYRAIYDVVQSTGFIAGCGPNGYQGNVRSFIKRVRRKFERLDPHWDEIENYTGMGYRWLRPDSFETNRFPSSHEGTNSGDAFGNTAESPALPIHMLMDGNDNGR